MTLFIQLPFTRGQDEAEIAHNTFLANEDVRNGIPNFSFNYFYPFKLVVIEGNCYKHGEPNSLIPKGFQDVKCFYCRGIVQEMVQLASLIHPHENKLSLPFQDQVPSSICLQI